MTKCIIMAIIAATLTISLTTADAMTALKAAAGLITLTAEQTAMYDMDGDGVITTADAMMILRKAAGLEQLTVDNGQLTMDNLSEEAELKLLENWAAYKGGFSADELTIYRYYGTFGGREAVVIFPKDWAMTADMQYIEIAGHTIALGSGSLELVVHDNGKFVPIREAYEQGWLIDEDIALIAGQTYG